MIDRMRDCVIAELRNFFQFRTSAISQSRNSLMSDVRPTKVIRVIARLNVGGPAKHVVWLTSGLQDAGFDSLLVTGSVPPGEEDMSYFARENAVRPFYIPEMSREISAKDAITIWKLFRLFLRE